MFVLSDCHIPSAATGTLLTLLILLTGTPTTPINALQCYKCSGQINCFKTYAMLRGLGNIEVESDFIVKFDTCSSPKEQCILHFTYTPTLDKDGQGSVKYYGAMYIDQAGCATPKENHPKLDGAGCFSSPGTKTANGTRTCYCEGADKCNVNTLSCYKCMRETNNCHDSEETTNFFAEAAMECQIDWINTKGYYDRFQDSVPFVHDDVKPKPRPPPCSSVAEKNEWDKHDRCTCQTNLCNVLPQGLKDYLAKDYPREGECLKCVVDTKYGNLKCFDDEYRCRPGTVCSSHYILKEGAFALNGLGCDTPPTSLNNGWYPPNLSKSDRKRSFYCDIGPNCTDPVLKCRTCKGRDCSFKQWIPLKTCVEGLREWTWRYDLPGRTKECFVSFDINNSPPKLVAGCRDFTLDKGLAMVDPICSLDLQKGWLRSGKGSCRCEIPECNQVLDELGDRDWKTLEVEDTTGDEETGQNEKIPIERRNGGGISNFKSTTEWGLGGFIMFIGQIFIILEIVP